jgi:hypothetical protein
MKTIFQCGTARANPDLQDTPEDRRVCPNPAYAHGDEGRVANFGLTTERGECPVCTAIINVIRQETYKEHIVSDFNCQTLCRIMKIL